MTCLISGAHGNGHCLGARAGEAEHWLSMGAPGGHNVSSGGGSIPAFPPIGDSDYDSQSSSSSEFWPPSVPYDPVYDSSSSCGLRPGGCSGAGAFHLQAIVLSEFNACVWRSGTSWACVSLPFHSTSLHQCPSDAAAIRIHEPRRLCLLQRDERACCGPGLRGCLLACLHRRQPPHQAHLMRRHRV